MKILTNAKASRKLVATMLACGVAAAALTGGVTQSMAAEAEGEAEAIETTEVVETAGTPAAPAVNTTVAIEGEATEADIDRYCYICHLHSDGASWNRENVNAAMVESMLPSMSDADIATLTAYFETIEPAVEEPQH